MTTFAIARLLGVTDKTRADVYVEHSPGFTFRLRLYP